MEKNIKFQFVELEKENLNPKKDENGELIIIDDISEVDYAAVVLPESYIAMEIEYYYESVNDKSNCDHNYEIVRIISMNKKSYFCGNTKEKNVLLYFICLKGLRLRKIKKVCNNRRIPIIILSSK